MKSEVDMKEELAYYKFLFDEEKILDKPIKYGGMFFAKVGKLYFTEFTDADVEGVKEKITKTRESIAEEKFEKNPKSCYFCGYKKSICSGDN